MGNLIKVNVSFKRTCCGRAVDATVSAETLHGVQRALGRLGAGRCGRCQRRLTETQNFLRMTGRLKQLHDMAPEDRPGLRTPSSNTGRWMSDNLGELAHGERWDLLVEHERVMADWHDIRAKNHTINRVIFPRDGVDIG